MWRLGMIYLVVCVVAAVVAALVRGPWEQLAAITSGLFFVLAGVAFVAWMLPQHLEPVRRLR